MWGPVFDYSPDAFAVVWDLIDPEVGAHGIDQEQTSAALDGWVAEGRVTRQIWCPFGCLVMDIDAHPVTCSSQQQLERWPSVADRVAHQLGYDQGQWRHHLR
jgi:hypothetical protein